MTFRKVAALRPHLHHVPATETPDPGAQPDSIAHLPDLLDDNAWRDALLASVRELDLPALTRLSQPSPSAHAAIDLSLPWSPRLFLRSGDMRNLRLWLESGQAPCRVELDLSENELGNDEAVHELAAMIRTGRLSSLKLRSCGLDASHVDVVCRAVEDDSHLASLQVSCDREEPIGRAIASMLANCSTLHTLDVGSCNLQTGCIAGIAVALQSNQTLSSLHLGGRWGNAGLLAMSHLLATNTSLLELNMRGAAFPDDVAGDEQPFDAFCDALAHHATLKHLALGHHAGLTARRASRLARALGENPALESLRMCDLDSSNTATAHAATLLEGLARNSRLQSLQLLNIKFDTPHCRALAALLKHPESRLASLDLKSIQWSDGSIPEVLVEAIRNNFELLKLNFHSHDVSRQVEQDLQQVLVRNWQLHDAAASAVNALWSRCHEPLPNDLVYELSRAFDNTATGRTMNGIAEAAFGKRWLLRA